MNFIAPNKRFTFLRNFSLVVIFFIFNQSIFGNSWLKTESQNLEKTITSSTKLHSFELSPTHSKNKPTNFIEIIEDIEVEENESVHQNFGREYTCSYLEIYSFKTLLNSSSNILFVQNQRDIPFYILFKSFRVYC